MDVVRKIEFWTRAGGSSPVELYLDTVEAGSPKRFAKIDALIRKIAEYGEGAADGRKVVKMSYSQFHSPACIIEIKVQPHRIYILITPMIIYLLEGRDKKSNRLAKDVSELICQRAMQTLTKSI